MGHATRSWPVIRHLGKRFEVHVFAGGKVYEYLVSRVEHLHWVQTLSLVYRNNSVDVYASMWGNIFRLPRMLWSGAKFVSAALALRPEVMVTDFEAIAAYMSFPLRLKTVAFDNQHVLCRTAVKYPSKYEQDAVAAAKAIWWTVPHANRYVVSTFFNPPIVRPNTRVVPPVVRPEVLHLRPSQGDKVLVYQTSDSNDRLIPTLNSVAGKFVVYGLGREEVVGNCSLRTFSEVRFLEDLSRARAVITNGGHTLITEALALGKPVLSEPITGHFEQILNAVYIEKMGVGAFVEKMTAESVQDFLENLEGYRAAIQSNYPSPDNDAALRGLEEAIFELSPALRDLTLSQQ